MRQGPSVTFGGATEGVRVQTTRRVSTGISARFGPLKTLTPVVQVVSLFPVGTLFSSPFAILNAVGLMAFALVGASKAIREEFDLLGIATVGLAMAFAGGATRDLLVSRIPLVLQSTTEIALGLGGVGLAVVLSVALSAPDTHPVTVGADAIGLAAFATTGAIVATQAGVSAFGVVAIATINAVGGGVLADILLDRAPFVLFDGFYASCAVLGGAIYWVAGATGAGPGTAALLCVTVTMATRVAAVVLGWQLPTAQQLGVRQG